MKNRLEELDGLRGITAFMVFLSHTIGLLAVTNFVNFYQHSPARIISDGAAAVDIFFVLSGFVLSLPFIDQNKNLNYFSFVTKRIFRLYPTYWVCILLTVFIKNYFDPSAMQPLSEWGRTLWAKPITTADIVRHLPLIFKTDTQVINPIIWTLAIEMKMSLVLPVFIFWIKKWGSRLSQILLLLTSVALSYVTGKFEFLPLFIIGLVLSKHWRYFEGIKNESPIKLMLLFILAIILTGNRFILNLNFSAHTQSLVAALGAALFILLAIWGGAINRALKHAVVDFLGKISYSFYLYHFPLLLVTVSLIYPLYESMLLAAAISLLLTILISVMSYKTIESNSMLLYRNLAGLISLRIG